MGSSEIGLGIISVVLLTLTSMIVPAMYGVDLDPDMYYVSIGAITGMAGYDLKRKADLKSIQ